jgi:hypothetical protein
VRSARNVIRPSHAEGVPHSKPWGQQSATPGTVAIDRKHAEDVPYPKPWVSEAPPHERKPIQ